MDLYNVDLDRLARMIAAAALMESAASKKLTAALDASLIAMPKLCAALTLRTETHHALLTSAAVTMAGVVLRMCIVTTLNRNSA